MKHTVKYGMTLLVLYLSLFLYTQAHAATFRSYDITVNGMHYRIDPRIELFNTVAMLFGHNGMTLSNIPYKQELLTHFSPWQQHPVVNCLLQTWEKGWGIDDPIFFMLSLNDQMEISPNLSPDIIRKGGGLPQLKKLAGLLKNFCQQSGFYSFFNETEKSFYEQELTLTGYNFKDFKAVDLLVNYYGVRQHSYNVILNINGGYGNFGTSFTTHGKTDLYAVVETNLAAGNLPVFAPTPNLFDLIIHEFSHSYVNPAIDAHADQLQHSAHLYDSIKTAMSSQGYTDWRPCVNEHIVRAAVTEIAEQYYGATFAHNVFYRLELGRRFIYLDSLRTYLAYYQQHRDQYPTFQQFVPTLLKAFDQITPENIAALNLKVTQLRQPTIEKIPKPFEFAMDSTTYFIYATHETDTAAQRQIQGFVNTYRNMFSTSIQLITDDEALQRNLQNNDLVVFGTTTGNSFLQRYISLLPISITKDSVLTNQVLTGDHYQVVASWVNPFNPHKLMAVYTAQQAKDIQRFYQSPVKDQYNYWVAKDLITINKGNYGNYFKVWMVNLQEP